MIREIRNNELDGLLELYTQLHDNPMPQITEDIINKWNKIINDDDHHIIVAEENGKIVSSCVCVIITNLTHEQRPYAFIENVITDEAYRGRGLATACLNFARDIAAKNNCYKIMLLTGSKKQTTLDFYKKAGYNCNDKTAFIMWL
ncbi:MAG: GNAT family N-acetyltransferase [Oscillospiraceae bacterium]|nr:GNAT family N-acetyltransferase [Oscillospiraceae bacterium]